MGQYDFKGNPPQFTWPAVSKYLRRRLVTLKPDALPASVELSNGARANRWQLVANPFFTLGLMPLRSWLFFLVAFLTWSWDAFDFFSVSLTTTEIADALGRPVKDITWGITLVLMLRPVGGILFGIPADRYGRRWPFVANCVCFIALQLGTGFVQTYTQFLAIRALLGVAIGGIVGNVVATALDDCPRECRGIVSGMFQLGYPFGYLLCVVFNQAITYTSPHGWRALFWFGSAPTLLLIVFRLCLPETDTFLAQQEECRRDATASSGRAYLRRAQHATKTYWPNMVYLVLFLAGMNFMSHGSQDLYPTFLRAQVGLSKGAATATNCVANAGAIAGSFCMGHASQFLGRRLTVLMCCVLGAALCYPWVYLRGPGLDAAVFFFQFAVQGAWATVPIYASELSPPEFRAVIVGTAYQLGNLASSASSTIEAKIGAQFPLTDDNGDAVPGKYDYGKVMAIFLGAVFAYVVMIVVLGPERRNASFVADEVQPRAAAPADLERGTEDEEKEDFEAMAESASDSESQPERPHPAHLKE